uniref:Uncharacterized protein n=1 Tax=Clytia hemisphaerica TaxID=252671 RepID=A0A7M5X4I9_9CNID|eukprot:TCONS_00021857-protein
MKLFRLICLSLLTCIFHDVAGYKSDHVAASSVRHLNDDEIDENFVKKSDSEDEFDDEVIMKRKIVSVVGGDGPDVVRKSGCIIVPVESCNTLFIDGALKEVCTTTYQNSCI